MSPSGAPPKRPRSSGSTGLPKRPSSVTFPPLPPTARWTPTPKPQPQPRNSDLADSYTSRPAAPKKRMAVPSAGVPTLSDGDSEPGEEQQVDRQPVRPQAGPSRVVKPSQASQAGRSDAVANEDRCAQVSDSARAPG